MENQLRKFESYRQFIARLFKCCGIETSDIKIGRLNLLAPLGIFVCTSMCCSILNFCRLHVSNLGLLTKGMSVFGSYLLVLCKLVTFTVYHGRISELDEKLNILFDESFKNERFRPIMLSLFHHFYSPAFIYWTLIFSVFLTYQLLPIIIIIFQLLKGVEQVHCILPMPSIYPWSVTGCGIVYQLHYAFHVLSNWYIMFVSCSTEVLFGYYVLRISAILRVASQEIQNSYSDDQISRVVIKHTTLIHACKILQELYGPMILIMTLSSAFVMCALCFQAFQTVMTVRKASLFAFYMTSKMTQAFMYAWYGTIITNESENFQKAVYLSNWTESNDVSLMKEVVIILSQRPIRLTACKFFYISLEMFVGIVNTTLSYFFLLKTLEEDNE